MKYLITTSAIIACCFIMACTKPSAQMGDLVVSRNDISPNATAGFARYSAADYSQSIPVDTANSMIGSYLSSVGYPSADTAVRSLTFDADTLRAYLQNPGIVTLKFMFAHQPAYKNGGNEGLYAGMNPNAITMIVVGLGDDDHYILNNRNGVYEHMSPCPTNCPGSATALISQ